LKETRLVEADLSEEGEEDSHLNYFLGDLWPELIHDQVELLESVRLKLRFILLG